MSADSQYFDPFFTILQVSGKKKKKWHFRDINQNIGYNKG